MSEENLSMDHLRARFREHLLLANYSPETVKEYCYSLDCFYEYLAGGRITRIEEVSKNMLRDYQISLAEGKSRFNKLHCVPYQNIKMKVVVYFFRFLLENDLVKTDMTRGIKYAKEPKRLPRNILTEQEVRKILEQPDIKSSIGFRDRTILEVLYSTAIRQKELRMLDLTDVDYHNGVLNVREGKGGKDRYVPLGKVACKFLEAYIQQIRGSHIGDSPTPALFLSQEKNRIGKSALDMLVRKYSKMAGIKKVISCHTWRHTCATHLVNNGMGIRHVQALLGHSSLNSTQIYTRVAIHDLKKVIKKHHPREKQAPDGVV